jgi:zinc transporter ZupT
VLAAYAGFFIFMGATDLLPEAHSHPSWRRVVLTVIGFAATAGVAYLANH